MDHPHLDQTQEASPQEPIVDPPPSETSPLPAPSYSGWVFASLMIILFICGYLGLSSQKLQQFLFTELTALLDLSPYTRLKVGQQIPLWFGVQYVQNTIKIPLEKTYRRSFFGGFAAESKVVSIPEATFRWSFFPEIFFWQSQLSLKIKFSEQSYVAIKGDIPIHELMRLDGDKEIYGDFRGKWQKIPLEGLIFLFDPQFQPKPILKEFMAAMPTISGSGIYRHSKKASSAAISFTINLTQDASFMAKSPIKGQLLLSHEEWRLKQPLEINLIKSATLSLSFRMLLYKKAAAQLKTWQNNGFHLPYQDELAFEIRLGSDSREVLKRISLQFFCKQTPNIDGIIFIGHSAMSQCYSDM